MFNIFVLVYLWLRLFEKLKRNFQPAVFNINNRVIFNVWFCFALELTTKRPVIMTSFDTTRTATSDTGNLAHFSESNPSQILTHYSPSASFSLVIAHCRKRIKNRCFCTLLFARFGGHPPKWGTGLMPCHFLEQ